MWCSDAIEIDFEAGRDVITEQITTQYDSNEFLSATASFNLIATLLYYLFYSTLSLPRAKRIACFWLPSYVEWGFLVSLHLIGGWARDKIHSGLLFRNSTEWSSQYPQTQISHEISFIVCHTSGDLTQLQCLLLCHIPKAPFKGFWVSALKGYRIPLWTLVLQSFLATLWCGNFHRWKASLTKT